MFLTKLTKSKSLVPDTQVLTSFTRRRVLAATLISGISLTLAWSWYMFMENASYTTIVNVPVVINNTSGGLQPRRTPIAQQIVPSYCRTENCERISCSSIPRGIDPGVVASRFIEKEFKEQCKNYIKSVGLSFINCKFPDNTLETNWLRTNQSIQELTFDSCSLNEIEDDAFISLMDVTTITLTNNNLISLRKKMFHDRMALGHLIIKQKSAVKSAELNLLEKVSGTITILQLEEGVIDNSNVLRNITGAGILPNLRELSIRYNTIPVISAELFKGVPAVKSLYVIDSKVDTVSADTLKPFVHISQFFLNQNKIISLPQGLFDSVVGNRNFIISVHDNPWHCDCSLKWMQDFIVYSLINVNQIPSCKTPPVNIGKSFPEADFCSQSDTTSPTTDEWTNPTTEPSITTTRMANVVCNSIYEPSKYHSRKLLSADCQGLPSENPMFNVEDIPGKGIWVTLSSPNDGMLLWFHNAGGRVNCRTTKEMVSPYLLEGIDPGRAYTICLLDDNVASGSPLNCQSSCSKPSDKATWLKYSDKGVVVTLFTLICILLFLVGGLIAFLMIRRHPALLSGSERVMLVKHRKVEAIVLPKGINIGDDADRSYRGKSEDGYVTPLPPIDQRNSWRSRRFSFQSDKNSYVSQIEATGSQLNSWRLMRLKSELERQTPNIPTAPSPTDTIPSVSFSIDTRDDAY